ncbi:hypothetical protein J3F84DRAFT_152383 [Trichoderma pleuroticola]
MPISSPFCFFPKLCFKADLNKYAHGRERGGRKGTRCFGVEPTNSGAQRARGYDTIRTAGQRPSTDYGYGSITVKPANPILHQAGFSLTSLPMPRDSSGASSWERVGSEAAVGQASEPGAASDNSSTISQGEHVRFRAVDIHSCATFLLWEGRQAAKRAFGLSGRPTQQGTI